MDEERTESPGQPRRIPDPRVWARHGLALILGIALLFATGFLRWDGCAGTGGANLLSGLRPVQSQGASNVEALSDGTRAVDGDHWQSKLTTLLRTPESFVDYDLGQSTPIRAAYLQGDNNDEYLLSVSEDGANFTPLWRASPQPAPGLQPRFTDQLQGQGRYVRLGVGRGDGSFSVSELQVFSGRPAAMPPAMNVARGLPTGETVRSSILLFAAALTFFLFGTWRGTSWSWWGLCLLVPVLAGIDLYRTLQPVWPVQPRDVAFVRSASAVVAGLAIVREVLAPRLYPASRAAFWTTLGLAGATAFLAFFNLGHPQFRDHQNRADLYVHNFDMRVYYPVAKYFPELRFDGVYKGSVAAFVDDDPNTGIDSLARVELRDLRTHRMRRVEDIRDEIAEVKTRFSPERWEEFKRDMRYFRETMGQRDYLGSMKDHGGNATPVWLSIAYLIFSPTQASNATLMAGALLDPILLLLTFFVIGRCFGWRTALVSMVVFGANDFYMFGSNWGGATLRHDWMAYLGLGICALKARWWVLGGALLALSASIRAFPALMLVGVATPAMWWLVDHYRRARKLPSWRAVLDEQRPILLVYLGAALASVVLLLSSSLLFSFDAWSEWLAKIRLLDRDPHVNHISWRALVAGSDHHQLRILNARMPVFVAGIVVAVAAVLAAGRSLRVHHAAALGLLLIPMVFNPANYYIHFVYALPLLATEVRRRDRAGDQASSATWTDAGVWLPLLGMCAVLYWTVLQKDLELHFQYATVVYFAAIIVMLAIVLRRDFMPALPGLVEGWRPALAPPESVPAPVGEAGEAGDETEPVEAPFGAAPSAAEAGAGDPVPVPAAPDTSTADGTLPKDVVLPPAYAPTAPALPGADDEILVVAGDGTDDDERA